jgi:ribosomal protein L13
LHPHKLSGHKVEVINAAKLDLLDKMDDTYKTFSGYPGGLKHETRGNLLKRRGISEILMRTVRGMLPRNKLRDDMLKISKLLNNYYVLQLLLQKINTHQQLDDVRHLRRRFVLHQLTNYSNCKWSPSE